MDNALKIFIFVILINWTCAMHVLNINNKTKSIRYISVLVAILSSAIAGLIVL
jgi:hypothetical protein